MSEPRRPRLAGRLRAVVFLALLLALACLLLPLHAPLRGAHTFRQTHVAGNIEKYVAHGLSLRPATYNLDTPGQLYDFPLYQLAAAGLCRATGWPVLVVARALNVLGVLGVWLLAAALMRRAQMPASQRATTLVLLAWSPLLLFYGAVPHVDVLALALSMLSLACYLRWSDARLSNTAGRFDAPLNYALMLVAGVAATLIKNPVFLPFFVGMAWHRLRCRGPRALLTPAFAAFTAALLAAVVGFKLYANHVNGVAGFLAPEEAQAYFGPPGDRLRRKFWRPILEALGFEVLPACAALLALLALPSLRRRVRGPHATLSVGLFGGVLAALLLFFNRHREHDYYQLPFVFPLALLAGLTVQRVHVRARALRRHGWRVAPAALALALSVGAAVALVSAAQRTWLLWQGPPGEVTERGAFLQAHTRPDDFVAFVVGAQPGNWDPTHLYFAQRDGWNLARSEVTRATFAALRTRLAGRYRRLFVFVPWPSVEECAPELRALGARLAVDADVGQLYWLEPSAPER